MDFSQTSYLHKFGALMKETEDHLNKPLGSNTNWKKPTGFCASLITCNKSNHYPGYHGIKSSTNTVSIVPIAFPDNPFCYSTVVYRSALATYKRQTKLILFYKTSVFEITLKRTLKTV